MSVTGARCIVPYGQRLDAGEGDDPEGADCQEEEGDGQDDEARGEHFEALAEGGEEEDGREEDGDLYVVIAVFAGGYGLFEVALPFVDKFFGFLGAGTGIFRHEEGTRRRGRIVERIKFLPGAKGNGVFGTETMFEERSEFFVAGIFGRDPAIEGDDIVETVLSGECGFFLSEDVGARGERIVFIGEGVPFGGLIAAPGCGDGHDSEDRGFDEFDPAAMGRAAGGAVMALFVNFLGEFDVGSLFGHGVVRDATLLSG